MASRVRRASDDDSRWKKRLLEGAEEVFETAARARLAAADKAQEGELYEQIGRLKMELEWLKKKVGQSAEELRWLLDPDDIRDERAAAVRAVGVAAEYGVLPAGPGERRELGDHAGDRRALSWRRRIYGRRRWTWWLRQCHGYVINPQAGGAADAGDGDRGGVSERRTTKPAPGHQVYPYLLRNVAITRPDQVWSTDITYVPLRRGFVYLTAVMDWYSGTC